jgi:hypothetical protein
MLAVGRRDALGSLPGIEGVAGKAVQIPDDHDRAST